MTTTTYNALVIDDENDARHLIKQLCQLYSKTISHCFEASTIEEAILLIKNHSISLVFLDVQLKNENGFAFLDYINPKTCSVIFTTAYQQYAVRAFRCAALDYLLKPIKLTEFKEGIDKFIEAKSSNVYPENFNVLVENYHQPLSEVNRIALPVKDGFEFITYNQISYCKADSNYTKIYVNQRKEYLASKTLGYFSDILPACFQRIHKSYLVNLNYVSSYNKQDDTVTLLDGTVLEVSTREKVEFLKRFARG